MAPQLQAPKHIGDQPRHQREDERSRNHSGQEMAFQPPFPISVSIVDTRPAVICSTSNATVGDTLAILSHDRPDVALLDMQLLDGPATPIAATLAAAGVPFALLLADRLDALEDVSLAGVPRIMKPWSAGDIEHMVEQLLASPAAGLSETLPAAAASSQATAPA